jgi:phosphoenolpyruvate carboxykinase (ATP)
MRGKESMLAIKESVKADLESVGIQPRELFYNLSYEEVFYHETDPSNEGCAKTTVTALGAVTVDTGKFTGRSPKDKYIVKDAMTKTTVWWKTATNGSDNKAISPETWTKLKENSVRSLDGRNVYIVDAFAGANPNTRLSVRLITTVAWAAHFAKNMFIEVSKDELEKFIPQWTIYHTCETSFEDYEAEGLASPVYVCFNMSQRETLIGGTWYPGEIKKGIFSVLNYFYPLSGIGAFHCSANKGIPPCFSAFPEPVRRHFPLILVVL